MDRNALLSSQIVHHSLGLQKNEKVLIEAFDVERIEIIRSLIEEIQKIGAYPIVTLRDNQVISDLLLNASKEQIELWTTVDKYQMETVDAYIGIRGSHNLYELSDIPGEIIQTYNQIYQREVRFLTCVKQKKWVILRYPNPSFAQLANMSTRKFEQFFYDVCTVDYKEMSNAMTPLIELMDQTDIITIKGKDTNLQFSIKGESSYKSVGTFNLPDGEIYTAPNKYSVNGYITFNTPSPYGGFIFEDIKLFFEDGKIVRSSANDSRRLEEILNTDEGSRYLGEFAIGVNPHILTPMKDILFDEKITGSIHLAIGECIEGCSNGNHSSIHWDMVLIQREEYGGGEIWFDDQLIRKGGEFVHPNLVNLNPVQLLSLDSK
ncbi:aminopeptidase [Bacillus sp. FJAT-49736]|uniref:aminopeptidase n=1 Tax=Bacillus sp. FJAT-49736 TaxID=2833582 RepID=UPI001BC963D1|nr:aminopeptidase [Bacillus sp. FJAT-49736]MBS4174751.1 aminopeptidase [Bacillus sp. FJAT-49736]